jgi:hypothetical protein
MVFFVNWQNEARSTMSHPSHRRFAKKPVALLMFTAEKVQWLG